MPSPNGVLARSIRDFSRALSQSHSALELVDKMMDLHDDLGNGYMLWTAAQAVFEGQAPSSRGTRGARACAPPAATSRSQVEYGAIQTLGPYGANGCEP